MKTRGLGFVVAGAVVFQIGVGCSSSSSSGPAANPDDAGGADSAVLDSGPTTACPKPTGGPTTHQGDIGTETWTAATSPHLLPYDLNIKGALTIEACAEVLLAKGLTVTVIGSISANGTATQPVHIGAQDPANPFVMIRTTGGTLHLSYTTVDGGGDPSNIVHDYTGMLNLQGTDQTKPSQETLFVDHVELKGSKTNGLVLSDGAGFATGSQNLTIDGSALYPMSLWSRGLGGIPTGTYTSNGTDEILVVGGGGNEGVAESETMHDRGVPYHVGNSGTEGILDIDPLLGGATSTLTIEAGVTVRFKKGGVFDISEASSDNPATAALIAVGTAAKPITFTSAEAAPAAGDWLGLYFGMQPLATNKLDYVKVQFAGGLSASGSNSCPYPAQTRSDGAIRIFGVALNEFVTNSTISDSAFFGFDRGWRNDMIVDFLPTNTFTNVANCQESYPKNTAGACPATPPCPM
jgi:hypothetical protein